MNSYSLHAPRRSRSRRDRERECRSPWSTGRKCLSSMGPFMLMVPRPRALIARICCVVVPVSRSVCAQRRVLVLRPNTMGPQKRTHGSKILWCVLWKPKTRCFFSKPRRFAGVVKAMARVAVVALRGRLEPVIVQCYAFLC